MSGYDNTNKGILGRNDRKEKDTHPDFKGNINIEGVEYWLSGWVKERKDGTGKFFSLSATPKDGQATGGGAKPGKTPGADLDDDIPFAAEWR